MVAQGQKWFFKRSMKVNEATKPINMIPLQKAWEKIGNEIERLNKKAAMYYYKGIFIMGVLRVSGTKTVPRIMFISRCTCDKPDQSWRVFWPGTDQFRLNQLNFDECVVEDPD
jgi:hypothetical protein